MSLTPLPNPFLDVPSPGADLYDEVARLAQMQQANNEALSLGDAAAGASAPVVTALPSGTITEGQEIYYVASTSPYMLWHLKYVAASAPRPWIYVGGSALFQHRSVLRTDTSVNGTYGPTFVNDAPQLTLPLAGDYAATYGWNVAWNGVGAVAAYTALLFLTLTGTPAVLTGSARSTVQAITGAWDTPAYTCDLDGRSANDVITLGFATDNGGANAWQHVDRYLSILPVAVG